MPLIGISRVCNSTRLRARQSNQIVPNGVSKCLPRMICMHTIKQKIYSLATPLGVADQKLTNGFERLAVENRQTVNCRLPRFAVMIVDESGIINSQLTAYPQFTTDDCRWNTRMFNRAWILNESSWWPSGSADSPDNRETASSSRDRSHLSS